MPAAGEVARKTLPELTGKPGRKLSGIPVGRKFDKGKRKSIKRERGVGAGGHLLEKRSTSKKDW